MAGQNAPWKPGKPPWWVVVSVAGSIVTILAFFGIRNGGQLLNLIGPGGGPAPVVTPTAPVTAPTTNVPNPQYLVPAPTYSAPLPTTTFQPPPNTPTFDPGTEDNRSTDQTQFTAAALLPDTFTDSNGIKYVLANWAKYPCVSQWESLSVQAALAAHECPAQLEGVYLEVGAYFRNDILVSVKIFPFDSSSTASQVVTSFNGGNWGFGWWCTPTGVGNYPCNTNNPPNPSVHNHYELVHRYLVQATTIYVDRSADRSLFPWLTAAAMAAINASGPPR